mmetsp:Transcript_26320/g.88187  ORF Transcript_26320/g.88187 Transcript_26320/m.88187 type:complete len:542 (-) Transcript_26320:1072-2697(-)
MWPHTRALVIVGAPTRRRARRWDWIGNRQCPRRAAVYLILASAPCEAAAGCRRRGASCGWPRPATACNGPGDCPRDPGVAPARAHARAGLSERQRRLTPRRPGEGGRVLTVAFCDQRLRCCAWGCLECPRAWARALAARHEADVCVLGESEACDGRRLCCPCPGWLPTEEAVSVPEASCVRRCGSAYMRRISSRRRMPGLSLLMHSSRPAPSKVARSGQPAGSPVMPTIWPSKPPSRRRRAHSSPFTTGIWLSMSTTSYRLPSVRMSRMASSPFTATSRITPSLRKIRSSMERRRMASSSTWSTRKSGGNWSVGLLEPAPVPRPPAATSRSVMSASVASGVALGRRSTSSQVAPLPRPGLDRRRREPLCIWSISRVMVSPRPVPPRPWSCPWPTCVKASPSFTVRSSSSVRPSPPSSTVTTRAGTGPASSSRASRTRTLPPDLAASVNLMALESTLLRHCCRRRSSPTKAALRSVGGRGSMARATPEDLAMAAKVWCAESKREARRKGAGTSMRRPESMRSKSSMSTTMPSMRLAHVLSVA